MVFDLLVDERGRSLVELPLSERRVRLERFAKRYFSSDKGRSCSRARPRRLATARSWLAGGGDGDLDGVVAKRARPAVPLGRARRDAEGEAAAHRRLRGRRIPLRLQGRRDRLAAARPVRRGGTARSRRVLLQHDATKRSGAQAASSRRCASRRGSRAGRRAGRAAGAPSARPSGSRWRRSSSSRSVRSRIGRPLPARHQVPAVAAGQGARDNARWSSCDDDQAIQEEDGTAPSRPNRRPRRRAAWPSTAGSATSAGRRSRAAGCGRPRESWPT